MPKHSKISPIQNAIKIQVALPSYWSKDILPDALQDIKEIVTNYTQQLCTAIFNENEIQLQIDVELKEQPKVSISIDEIPCRLQETLNADIPYMSVSKQIALYCNEGIFRNRALFVETNFYQSYKPKFSPQLKNLSEDKQLQICHLMIQYGHSLALLQKEIRVTNNITTPEEWFECIVAALSQLSLSIEMSSELFFVRHAADTDTKENLVQNATTALFYELGMLIPQPIFKENKSFDTHTFQFWLNDLPYAPLTTIPIDSFVANKLPSDDSKIMNDPRKRNHSFFCTNHGLSSILDYEKTQGERLGWHDIVTYNLIGILIEYPACWLNISVVQHNFNGLLYHDHLKEIFLRNFSIEKLTQLLRQLLTEQIPIRNLRKILEGCISTGDQMQINMSKIEFPPDLSALTVPKIDSKLHSLNIAQLKDVMRKYLREEMSLHLSRDNNMNMMLVHIELENEIINSNDDTLNIHREDFMTCLNEELRNVPSNTWIHGILVGDFAREKVQSFVEIEYPWLLVLSYRELSTWININTVARVG